MRCGTSYLFQIRLPIALGGASAAGLPVPLVVGQERVVFIGGGPAVWTAYARLIQHWDITRLPYDGPADRWFDPAWLCGPRAGRQA